MSEAHRSTGRTPARSHAAEPFPDRGTTPTDRRPRSDLPPKQQAIFAGAAAFGGLRASDCEDTGRNTNHLLPGDRLAVDAGSVAKLLQVSTRHVRRLDAAGQLPRPVRLGNSVRWVVPELQAWLEAGAPPREQWERLKSEACA